MNRFPQTPLPKDDFTSMTFNLNFQNQEEKCCMIQDKDMEKEFYDKDMIPLSPLQLYKLNSANNLSIDQKPSAYSRLSKYSDTNVLSSLNLGSYRKVTMETNDSSTNILKLQIFDIEIQKIKNKKYKSKTNTYCKIKEQEIPLSDIKSKNYSKDLLKILVSPYSESEAILNNYYNQMKNILCSKDASFINNMNNANNFRFNKERKSGNNVNDKNSTQCDNESLESK